MDDEILEIVEILEMLLEDDDISKKIRVELNSIVSSLKNVNLVEELMPIQDRIEAISSSSQIDDYMRNELINVVAVLEGIYNS